jgi:hypothetical protein
VSLVTLFPRAMSTTPAACSVDLPDDLWKRVLCQLRSPATMASMAQVSTKFRRLSTSDDVFRSYVLQRTDPTRKDDAIFQAKSLSWRAVYRNMIAMHHSFPTMVPDFRVSSLHGQVTLLATSETHNAIFHHHESDLIIGWPKAWSVPRLDICNCDPSRLQSAVISLGGGDIGLLMYPTVTNNKWLLAIINSNTGDVTRRVTLPCGSSTLSTTWCRGAVHNSPIVLCAGPQGRHVVYLTEAKDLYVVDVDSRCVSYVWRQLANPFGELVRGPGLANGPGFVAIGIVNRDRTGPRNCFDLKRITDGEDIGKMQLSQNETLIDVVAHEGDSQTVNFIACRVVSRDEQVVAVLRSRTNNGTWTMRRDVLNKTTGVAVHATAEFEILTQGRGLLYRPEGMLRFHGPIRILTRHEGIDADVCYLVHWLAYARVGGSPFRWARLSGDGRLLYACSFDNGVVSVFNLNAGGRCLGSLRAPETIKDIVVLHDHLIVATTDARDGNTCGFHFGRFCRSVPECLLPPPSPV